jgi:23S rRNA pseudouridine2605 synthase
MNENDKISLSKYLSISGVASRRKSTEFIKAGTVKVNGETVFEPGLKISAEDVVSVQGREVCPEEHVYIMLNKPTGYVCTNEDPHAPQKAIDLIDVAAQHRLFSIGRLDKNSEGLLLFTNDGAYSEKLMHPRYEVLKTYIVKTDKEISDKALTMLLDGIVDDGEFLKPRKITRQKSCLYEFVLNEGKKREIRRMIAAAGCRTMSLKRIAIGKLVLGNLPKGQYRLLSKADIAASLE